MKNARVLENPKWLVYDLARNLIFMKSFIAGIRCGCIILIFQV